MFSGMYFHHIGIFSRSTSKDIGQECFQEKSGAPIKTRIVSVAVVLNGTLGFGGSFRIRRDVSCRQSENLLANAFVDPGVTLQPLPANADQSFVVRTNVQETNFKFEGAHVLGRDGL